MTTNKITSCWGLRISTELVHLRDNELLVLILSTKLLSCSLLLSNISALDVFFYQSKIYNNGFPHAIFSCPWTKNNNRAFQIT